LKKVVIISVALSVVLALFILVFVLSFGTNLSSDMDKYEERRMGYRYASNVLPDLNNLPEYEEIEHEYRLKNVLFFQSETLLLVVTYDEQTYFEEKEKLAALPYLDSPIEEEERGYYLIPEHEFSINTFDFKVLASEETNEESRFEYPKYFGMIGVSDEKKSIAYLYFCDVDLDYISEEPQGAMREFVETYFKYNW